MSEYVRFEYKGSVYRLSRDHAGAGRKEIKDQRTFLETYIDTHPEFASSLEPVSVSGDAPEIARDMAAAADACGVGPMASVAGAVALRAAAAMVAAGAAEAIVDNGGDVAIMAAREVVVGIFAGAGLADGLAGGLALRFPPEILPCGVCSSSAKMGHSMSFGRAELATVVADTSTLADAAVTRLCNSIKHIEGATEALESIAAVPGVRGALAVIDGNFAMIGEGIDLVRHADSSADLKVTAHEESDYRDHERLRKPE